MPRRSYTSPILEIACVRPLREAIESRRISALLQFLTNELTQKLILSGETNYSKTIAELGFIYDEELTMLANKNQLVSMCLERLKVINEQKNKTTKSLIAQAVEQLLRNDTKDNHRLVRTILHAENGFRDIVGIG